MGIPGLWWEFLRFDENWGDLMEILRILWEFWVFSGNSEFLVGIPVVPWEFQ